jgi:hypothetical protein
VCNYILIYQPVSSFESGKFALCANDSTEWASGDKNAIAQWETDRSSDVAYHKVWRQTQLEFDESDKPHGNGMAEWGTVYWATDSIQGLTVQSGPDVQVRDAFVSVGALNGFSDSRYRAISEDWPVFAFVHDLGHVGSEPQSRLFSIGLLQQNAVQFLGASGLVKLPSLWKSYFANEAEAVSKS